MVINKVRLRIIVISIFMLPFIIIVTLRIYSGYKKAKQLFANQLPTVRDIPDEYFQLISKKYQKYLAPDITYQRKGRSPIAFINFDSIYDLVVYKLDSVSDFSFSKQYHFNEEKMDISNGEAYSLIYFHGFELQYVYAPAKKISQIYFTLYSDSLKVDVENDSLICYSSFCRNFSLRYGENMPIDFLLSRDEKMFERIRFLPMSLLFLKRNGSIFFMFMTPRFNSKAIPPRALYNTVTGNGNLIFTKNMP